MTKYCPSCGEELVDNAKFCKNCGATVGNAEESEINHEVNTQQFQAAVAENDHKWAIIIGYILAVLIPLFGTIASIYLLTRKDSENAKRHGKYVLIVALAVWIISLIFFR